MSDKDTIKKLTEEIEDLKITATLTFLEISHLRKQLELAKAIPETDLNVYLDSLDKYTEEFSQKHRHLKENYPHVWK
jgi:hypothetical protein